MMWAGHAERMDEIRNAYKIFVGKPEGKRTPGRQRRRWACGCGLDSAGLGFGLMADCCQVMKLRAP
jgi:hypothetical protein